MWLTTPRPGKKYIKMKKENVVKKILNKNEKVTFQKNDENVKIIITCIPQVFFLLVIVIE